MSAAVCGFRPSRRAFCEWSVWVIVASPALSAADAFAQHAREPLVGARALAGHVDDIAAPLSYLAEDARGKAQHLARVVGALYVGVNHLDACFFVEQVDEPHHHPGLGPERRVDRLDGDAGAFGQPLHGRVGEALFGEQLPGGLEDRPPGHGGVLLAQRNHIGGRT